MSVTGILDPDTLLRMVKADLESWAADNQAEVFAAQDEYSALMQLAASPDGFVIVVNDAGDRNASPHAELYMIATRVDVSVGFNPGLHLDRGDPVLLPEDNVRGSLLAACAAVRTRMLEQVVTDASPLPAEPMWSYVGRKPTTLPGGVPLRAYTMTFELHATLAETTPREIFDEI